MTDWHIIAGTLSGLLAALAVIPYIKDIIKGTTRPNIVSWALWVILLGIALAAQISAGASWSVVFLVGDFVGTSLILVLCAVGYGYKQYGLVEWVCLALAIVAILSWQLTRQPILAIIFAVLADLMASIPTLVKAYKDPWSEHPSQWLIIGSASLLGLVSTTVVNASNIVFPAYLLLINSSIGLLSLAGRKTKKSLIS